MFQRFYANECILGIHVYCLMYSFICCIFKKLNVISTKIEILSFEVVLILFQVHRGVWHYTIE